MFFSQTPSGRILALLFLAATLAPRPSSGYALNGYHWPDGADIVLHLGLSGPPANFSDGSTSWNVSAADALRLWNQYIAKVRFVESGTAGSSGGDGLNSVFFADSIYGQSFGPNVIAFTTYFSQGNTFTETDVIFNSSVKWGSYRGPVRKQGNVRIHDLHRTALHEFGHVLGLGHPDEYGQPGIEAIMNSVISDLDHLSEDDIAGAQALYGLKITSVLTPASVPVGESFSYRILANNNPTSFSAEGLPPGLQLDPNSTLR